MHAPREYAEQSWVDPLIELEPSADAQEFVLGKVDGDVDEPWVIVERLPVLGEDE